MNEHNEITLKNYTHPSPDKCVIDPFEAFSSPEYLKTCKYLMEVHSSCYYSEAPRRFDYKEACAYIEALPSSGLINRDAEHIPIGAWIATSVASEAAYTVAAHSMLIPNDTDLSYLQKIADLFDENDEVDVDTRKIIEANLPAMSAQSRHIDDVVRQKAQEAGQDFKILRDVEQSYLTGRHPRTKSFPERDVSSWNAAESEYHAKWFEHNMVNEYIQWHTSVVSDVFARMEYEKASATKDDYMSSLSGIDIDASAKRSAFFESMRDGGCELFPVLSVEEVWRKQREGESRIYGQLKRQMDNGYGPSESFWSVVEFDDYKTWVEHQWLERNKELAVGIEMPEPTEWDCPEF